MTLEQPLFVTERLAGRRLTRADADAMLAVYADEDAMRFVGDGSAADRAEIDAWIGVTLGNYATRGYGMVALEHREDGTVAGFAGLVHPGGQREPELKYAFHRRYWGRGLATEGARAMLAWGHGDLGLDEIIATIHPDHVVSRRVLERVGMVSQGQRTDADGKAEEWFVWRAGVSGSAG